MVPGLDHGTRANRLRGGAPSSLIRRLSNQIQIRVVENEAEFAALAPAWEAMQAGAAIGSVFASFDWQYLWWRTYGHGAPLKLLVASAGDQPIGLLPLHVKTVPALKVPVRQLQLGGIGGDTWPDDLGPILAAGREAQAAQALAEAVVALPGWDVMLLSDMDPASPFTAAVEAAARKAGLATRAGRSERIAYVDLPATFDAWLQSLHRDRRYRVRNMRKKLNAAHKSRFFVFDDPATLDQGIDRLIYLHRKRWGDKSQAFASDDYVGFHRAVMGACLGKNRLRLYALEIDGQVAAMYYFYKFRDTVYLMQSGFDPELGDVKPGQVLLGHIVEHAIGEGHKVLDFLRGDHRYKDELASGERETRYVSAFRNTPGGVAYRLRRQILPAAKAQALAIRQRLRPPAAEVPEQKAAP
jgi:CelD/BcsL family acetyltransferase involved in cellulose biosynthesis